MHVGQAVARKSSGKAGKSESRRFGVLVRLGDDVVADCKVVASYRGISLAEYITESMRLIAKKDMDDEHEKRKRSNKPS